MRSDTLPALLACVALLTTALCDAQSLLTNGDFESGTDGWVVPGDLGQHGAFGAEPDAKRASSVGTLANGSETQLLAVWQTFDATPGKRYRITGYSRSTKLQQGGGVAVHALSADGQVLQRRWVHQIPEWGILGWRAFRAEYRPPKGTVRLSVRLSLYKKGTAWFDDVAVTELAPQAREEPWGERLQGVGVSVRRMSTSRPVYCLDVADVDTDGSTEFVIGDIDGALRVQEWDGDVAWERELGGLPLSIDCGDLDADGSTELVVCTAAVSGSIRTFSHVGEPGWTFALPGVVFGHVTVGDLDGDGACEVFVTHGNELIALSGQGKVLWRTNFGGPRMRCVALGDVTGDGETNVVASMKAQRLFASALDRRGQRAWLFQPVGAGGLSGEDVCVADVDGDGKADVVMGCSGGTVVCVQQGEVKWVSRRERSKLWAQHRDATARPMSARTQIAVGDFVPELPGLETVVALVDRLWIIDRDGKFIWETESGILLLDLIADNDGGIYAPSSGFRDTSLYALRIVRGEGNALAEHMIANPIYHTLERTYEQAASLAVTAADVSDKFHVILANLLWPFGTYGSLDNLRETHAFLQGKENDRLEYLFMLWPKDLPVELDRGQMSEPEAILAVASFLEELGRPFLFFVDHGCAPNLSLQTMRRTLELAPQTCRGFYVAENTARYPTAKWDEFVVWAMQVMDLCLEFGGKKLIFKEMFDAWCVLPADPRVRDTLLQPKYRDTVVVMYATNNPHAPELQTGGMVGLAQAGLVSEWGISTQYWNWSWAEHGLSEHYANICPADVVMRMELSAACLGARWFHIEGGQEYLLRADIGVDPRAKRHRDLVYELMRKRVLLPVRDEDNLTFSPLCIVRSHHPELDRCRREGQAVGTPRARPVGPLRTGLLGVSQTVQTVTPEYLPGYAYGVRRYGDTMFPPMPYGFLRFVPDCDEGRSFVGPRPMVLTDGCDVFLDGARVEASRARELVLPRLRAAAESLPFRAPGASLYVHRVEGGHRLWLLDPGYMWPVGVETAVEIRLRGRAWTVGDVLTGETLPCEGNRFPVGVPAGAFRVIDVAAAE